MKIPYTAFGQTRSVEVTEFHNMKDGETPEQILWVDRYEDYYALMSSQLKDKKVAILKGSAWRNADPV